MQHDPRLTCFVPGYAHPVPPTDVITFKGSGAWARVGINRKFGGIAVELDLINPASPDTPLPLIEARSAGGAAWQTSIGAADAVNDRLLHFNQAAGNSAHNWGFESRYSIGQDSGIIQQDWLPILTNDYRHPDSVTAPDTLTSPCNHPGFKLGEGKFTLVPSLVPSAGGSVLRLEDTYVIRSEGDQDWQWLQVDQGMYITLTAARVGHLRVYIAQARTGSVVGPVRADSDKPVELTGQVRGVSGVDDDWFISTWPASYVVLVFNVAGRDIGIAMHRPGNAKFTGFLRSRQHIYCKADRDECGSIQWHSSLAMSRWDNSVQTRFKSGTVTPYAVVYDIAPLPQLAALGYKIH